MQGIYIPGVNERDIDLLMLEEFLATPAFGAWFAEKVLGTKRHPGKCVGAVRSVTQSSGESDLEVAYVGDDGNQTLVLVENKIAAGLQPKQAERYLERGADYVTRDRCTTFHTVIVAPDRYFVSDGQTKGFHSRLSYEAILAWFEQATELGERRRYKVAMLASAIEKATLGYQAVTDEPVTRFWQDYWRLCIELAPDLEMPKPEVKPSGSGFVAMRPPALKLLKADIVHKVNKGYVDLQLRKMGPHLNAVRNALGPLLEEGMSVQSATGSAAIRIDLPKMSTLDSLASQEAIARSGITAAKRLLDWGIRHRAPILEVRSTSER